MNFDALPSSTAKVASGWPGAMVGIGLGLVVFFWRKRYLARTGR